MMMRRLGLIALCCLASSTYADVTFKVWPEEAKADLQITADNQQASAPLLFEDKLSITLAHSESGDTVLVHATGEPCCISYDFLNIPIPRAWWVSVEHAGHIDYLCDRNDALVGDASRPQLYLGVAHGDVQTRLTFQPNHYCAEDNRVSSKVYVPSYWHSVTVSIH